MDVAPVERHTEAIHSRKSLREPGLAGRPRDEKSKLTIATWIEKR